MTSVSLSGYVLDEALIKLEDLASDIDIARSTANALVPPQLSVPSLSSTGVLGQVPTWLREQKLDPITVLRDLAYLLDETGSTVEFTQTSSDLLADARTEIGEIYADRIADLGDIDSAADREAAEEMLEGFSAYADDPEVSAAMLNALGPEGLNDAFYRLQGLIANSLGEEPNYNDYGGDRFAEVEALKRLQDLGADVLARATASASTANLLDDGYAEDFVNNDARGWGVATLFQYADKAGVALGTDFLVDAGEAILQREQELGGADSWYESAGITYDTLVFGTDADDDSVMNDPGLQWLQALDSNPDASQIIFADEDNAEYLLGERSSMYEDPQGHAAGRALKAATTDLALEGTREQQETAAQIASHVVEHFGGGADLLDGADEGVATMISTYIADMDRVISRTDSTAGIYQIGDPDAPPLPDWLDPTSVPQFGIDMDLDQLRGLLKQVGDNDDAISTIVSTAGRYDQVRMDWAAGESLNGPNTDNPWNPQTGGDPFIKSVNESAAFQGFLTDAMYNGDIDDAQEVAAHRQRVASLMTLPIDYFIKVPGAGEALGDVLKDPVGAFLYGQLKTEATSAFVGDGVSEAMASGNANWDINRGSVRLQSLYALMNAQSEQPSSNPSAQPQSDGTGVQFNVGADLRDAWPTSGGRPIPPGDLEPEEIELILDLAEQGTGYSPAVGSTVDTAFDNLAEHWSGN